MAPVDLVIETLRCGSCRLLRINSHSHRNTDGPYNLPYSTSTTFRAFALTFHPFPSLFLYIACLLSLPHKFPRAVKVKVKVIHGTIKVPCTAFSGPRLWLQCLARSTALWYFNNHFKYFYSLTPIPQYFLSVAPKKPREANIWAEIAEYMSIQDQTIVDERELLEEHQFLLNLESVRPLLITICTP